MRSAWALAESLLTEAVTPLDITDIRRCVALCDYALDMPNAKVGPAVKTEIEELKKRLTKALGDHPGPVPMANMKPAKEGK